jgi:DNA-binding NarL/FixJ family response regulator
MSMTKLLIVDDHQVLIDGIRALLEKTEGLLIEHQALSGKIALQVLAEHEAEIDLIILDINMPDMNGFEVCQEIKKRFPGKKILTLTMHEEPGFISKMVKAGTDGYVLKSAGKDELVSAITTIMSGEKHFGKAVTDSLLQGMQSKKPTRSQYIPKLTRREKEVLQLIIQECSTEEIAEKLFISDTTVISHRKSLLRKLNVKNAAGLVRAAYEYNLLAD